MAGPLHHLELTLHVGSRLPSYCSATGKALLAFLPWPDLDQLVDRIDLVQRGPRTLTSKKALLAELDQVRRTGVAVNDEELESALRSIAVPVRSRSGQVIAAVNIAIPWSPEAITDLVGQHAPALPGHRAPDRRPGHLKAAPGHHRTCAQAFIRCRCLAIPGRQATRLRSELDDRSTTSHFGGIAATRAESAVDPPAFWLDDGA